jgi:hypothetical protein
MTEKQERALKIKGSNKIYFGRERSNPIGLVCEIADLSMCTPPEPGETFWTIPYETPDWLHEVLEIFGLGYTFDELQESVFDFEDLSDIDEIKGICDIIIEV